MVDDKKKSYIREEINYKKVSYDAPLIFHFINNKYNFCASYLWYGLFFCLENNDWKKL